MKKEKLYTIILSATILATTFASPISATTNPNFKEENVYALLKDNGTIDNVYVVNTLDIKDGQLLDYGNYSSIKNLSSLDELTFTNDEVTATSQSNKVYYEGALKDAQLPWNIAIKYTLDGTEISADDLAGKSGNLEVSIAISQNHKGNNVFFENYALQISSTLDTSKCDNISAPDATIANIGETKNITFTNLPNKENTYKFSATVDDFEMVPITISAVPFSMNIDLSSMDNISENLVPLQNGISQVNDGAKSLEDGATLLYYAMDTLNQNSNTLVNGSNEIYTALKSINDSLSEVEKLIAPDGPIVQLKNASDQYLTGISVLASNSTSLVTASSQISAGITATNNALTTITTDSSETKQLIQALASMNNENVNMLIALYNGKMDAVSNVNAGLDALLGQYTEFHNGIVALSDGATKLAQSYNELNSAISALSENLVKLDSLIKGIDTLSTEYGSFNNGVIGYTDGYKMIVDGYTNLVSGITDISFATNEINSKTSTLDKELEKQLDTALSDFKNSDFKPVSFVSDKNTNVTAVQFVMKTEEIKKEVATNTVEETTKKLSFIDKFKNLFK